MHIDTGAEMRGGQHQVLLLLKALREAGDDCRLLTRAESPLWSAAADIGFDVAQVSARNLWQHSSDADIVHAHDARAHTLAALACRTKFVVSRRVAFPVRRSPPSFWKYRRASRYLAVSEFVAAELRAAGIPAGKIAVVYDAVDCGLPDTIWNPEFPAVALASHDPQKGRDLIEQAARMSGVEVRFSSELVSDLQRASMFVYITRSEGLGSAVLLAMKMGVPVIASRIGGLAEVFSDGVSGIYVNNDVSEIVRAMRRILSTRRFGETLIQNAKVRIEECFTKRQLTERTLAAYRSAILA